MNVLVVDPDPQLAIQVRSLLAHTPDLAVEAAESGTDAWFILGNFGHTFDVVVIELSLPDIGGVELLARIRRSPKHGTLPILVCSSLPHRDTVAKVLALGIRHFLVKPAGDDLVRAKLHEIIGAERLGKS